MKVPWWLPLAGAVFLSGAVWWYGSSQRKAGRLEGRLEGITQAEKQAAQTVAKADTVYERKRDTLRYFKTRYDSIRVTDTVVVVTPVPGRSDTVRVFIPRDVADSTVQMCTRTLNSCDASLQARDSLLSVQRLHIKSLEALKGKRCKLGVGPGIGAGWDWRGRPTVMAGVNFGFSC